jgi:3-phenylpropionate/trans-cinnamate dioxygenase ferredoxin subunit
MSKWYEIIKTTDFPVGTRKVIDLEGTSILLLNLEGNYYAIRNLCSHQNFPLEDGDIEDCIITCPLHGAKFSIQTGAVKAPPAFEDIATYEVRVENDMIQINI